MFSVRDISVFGLETRTNNDVEGYHSRINTKAGAGKLHDIINNRFNVCTYRYNSDIATDLPQVTISCNFKRQNYVYHIGPYILFRFPSLLPTCHFLNVEAEYVRKTVLEVFREERAVRRVRKGSKSVTNQLTNYWAEYVTQRRTALALVEAASNLLANF